MLTAKLTLTITVALLALFAAAMMLAIMLRTPGADENTGYLLWLIALLAYAAYNIASTITTITEKKDS